MTEILEGGVSTKELNMNLPVQDIVKDYKTKVHERSGDDLETTPREYMEPNKEATRYVEKGRLDPRTGLEILPTPKTRSSQIKQFGIVSEAYKQGYDQIEWDR
jgi:hypothetical protein